MKRSTKVWIAVACVAAACAIAAAVTIPLVISSGNKPVARIGTLEVLRADGSAFDLDKVPLDTELVIKVGYEARFKEGGTGTLRVMVSDSDGDSIIDKTYDVRSGPAPQTKETAFEMTQGSGRPLEAKADLKVTQGGQKPVATKTLEFTAVAGKGKELQLEEAREAAAAKCREATDLLKSASAKGVDVSDLADRMSGALGDLADAGTVEQAEAVTAMAQAVIDECSARVAAAVEQHESADECRKNQAVIRAKLLDWWSGNGYFPDSLAELYGLPGCPSGGTYTYYAPDTTPATLHVSCSVHGEL